MENENTAMASFREFLDENGWRYLADDDGALRGLVSGDNGQCCWYAQLNGDARFLVFKSFFPVYVSARRRPAVAEYLMRANWGMNFGNFEIDWSDGQVSFRTSVTTHELNPSSDALSDLVYGNQFTMNRYFAGLLAVACGGASPGKAIGEAEKDLQPPAASTEQNPTPATDDSNSDDLRGGKKHRRFSPNDN